MIRLKSLLTEGSILKVGAITRGVDVAKSLKAKLGLKSFQAAAIVGNFVEESGVRADALQDMKGTGNYIPGPLKVDGRTGYSFAQWTYKDRQKSLLDFAKGKQLDISKYPLTTAIAVAFVVYELTGTMSNVLDKLKASKNISAATNIILKQYEMPANQGPSALAARTANAQAILDLLPVDGAPAKTAAPKPKPIKKSTPTMDDIYKQLQQPLDMNSILGAFDNPKASTPKPKTSTTAPSTYVVVSGDTLGKIATKYKTTIPNLKKINNLKTDTIKVGQKLKVK
jgi:LysM repeat protein